MTLKSLKKDGIAKKKILDGISYGDINEYRKRRDDLVKNMSSFEIDIRNANKIIKALNEYDVCPTCNSDLTGDHKDLEMEKQNEIISDATKQIEIIKVQVDSIAQEIKSIDDLMTQERDLKYTLKDIKTNYSSVDSQITKLQSEHQKLAEKQFVVDVVGIKKEYKMKNSECNENIKELDTLNTDISNYTDVVSLLSDTGIKSYIFEQLIPVLNKSVNYYLNLFELPVYIEFDNTMSDNIKSINNFNADVSYMSFSEGEKKRIDMAILLSFIDVTKKVSNWNCNVLIIDELLDSSIDDTGLEKLLESIEKMILEDETMGVYIISHRFKLEYKHFFSRMLEITKSSEGFSKIETLN